MEENVGQSTGLVGNDEQGFCASFITVHVKHGKETLPISLSPKATMRDLMEHLQRSTNVFPRAQKLIFKGKVLDADLSLESANISNGSKVMLMVSQGLHQASASVVKKEMLPVNGMGAVAKQPRKPLERSRIDLWKATGIITLRDSALQITPSEVWSIGSSARILDIGGNCLQHLPAELNGLINLQKLRLSGNGLNDIQFEWQILTNLRFLSKLVLDHNLLTHIPSEVGLLLSLTHLSVSHNRLVHMAEEVGKLLHLEKLELSYNCLTTMPSSLGCCSSLIEVDLSTNFLKDLPSTLGGLRKLKVLNLENNALKFFPEEILRGCVDLSTLSLHKNELTMEDLRKMDGWSEFDERRKLKYSKQLDFNVMGSSSGFDEGADTHQWHHW